VRPTKGHTIPHSPSRITETRLLRIARIYRKTLFFVVGCQKTGTTWVQQLFNGHPQAVCCGETDFGGVLFPELQKAFHRFNQEQKAGKHGVFGEMNFRDVIASAIGTKLADWAEQKPQAIAIGEKTPEHAQILAELATVFPAMRAVHVVRDPRDVIISGWHHNMKQAPETFQKTFSSLKDYAEYLMAYHWRLYVEKAETWGRHNPDTFTRLRYEDLLTDPAAAISPACQMLGLSTDEVSLHTCVEHAHQATRAKKNSDPQAASANTSGSFFRKGQAGGWKTELPQDVVQLVESMAGDWMHTFGYETSSTAPHTNSPTILNNTPTHQPSIATPSATQNSS